MVTTDANGYYARGRLFADFNPGTFRVVPRVDAGETYTPAMHDGIAIPRTGYTAHSFIRTLPSP